LASTLPSGSTGSTQRAQTSVSTGSIQGLADRGRQYTGSSPAMTCRDRPWEAFNDLVVVSFRIILGN
jgi:hypothetical protein